MKPLVPVNSPTVSQFVANLSQAAGEYTLCTASDDVLIEDIQYYVRTAATTLDSVQFYTSDTNPLTLLTTTEGARANLVTGKTLRPAEKQQLLLRNSKRIYYAIAGSTGTGEVLVTIRWRPAGTSSPTLT